MLLSSQRDNKFFFAKELQERIYQEKPIFQGLQRLWKVVRCAGIYIECNKYIDMYRTFFSSDTGKCPFLRVSTSGATDSK